MVLKVVPRIAHLKSPEELLKNADTRASALENLIYSVQDGRAMGVFSTSPPGDSRAWAGWRTTS